MTRNARIAALLVALASPALAQDATADLGAWSQLDAAGRANHYLGLSSEDRKALDERVQGWVLARCQGTDEASFAALGRDLDLVPRVALATDPLAKARLVGEAFGRLASAQQASPDARTRALAATLSSALASTSASGHQVVVGSVVDHGPTHRSAVRLDVDGQVFAADPARHGEATPIDQWMGPDRNAAVEDDAGRQGTAVQEPRTVGPLGGKKPDGSSTAPSKLSIEPRVGVVLEAGDTVKLTATKVPGVEYRWTIKGGHGRFQLPSGSQAESVSTGSSNEVIYVAREHHPGTWDTIQVEARLPVDHVAYRAKDSEDGPEVSQEDVSVIWPGATEGSSIKGESGIACPQVMLSPRKRFATGGARVDFGLTIAGGLAAAGQLTARYRVSGNFGHLAGGSEVSASERVTYVCTSQPRGKKAGEDRISCDVFYASRKIASVEGVVVVAPEGRDEPLVTYGSAYVETSFWSKDGWSGGSWGAGWLVPIPANAERVAIYREQLGQEDRLVAEGEPGKLETVPCPASTHARPRNGETSVAIVGAPIPAGTRVYKVGETGGAGWGPGSQETGNAPDMGYPRDRVTRVNIRVEITYKE